MEKMKVAVISDVHLGTYGCHAEELNTYLKSIDPEILIINGDFIDIWQLSKFFPDSHWRVIQRVIKMMLHGTQVYYLTGNHNMKCCANSAGSVYLALMGVRTSDRLNEDEIKFWLAHEQAVQIKFDDDLPNIISAILHALHEGRRKKQIDFFRQTY